MGEAETVENWKCNHHVRLDVCDVSCQIIEILAHTASNRLGQAGRPATVNNKEGRVVFVLVFYNREVDLDTATSQNLEFRYLGHLKESEIWQVPLSSLHPLHDLDGRAKCKDCCATLKPNEVRQSMVG